MNYSRIIGDNITIELKNRSLSLLDLGDKIGFSDADMDKLTEGRLFLPPFQLTKIADAIGTTIDELIDERSNDEYSALIHNFRDFNNPDNQELILDMIDMYADLEEAVE